MHKGPTTPCGLSYLLSLPLCPLFHHKYIPDHIQVPQWRSNTVNEAWATYTRAVQKVSDHFVYLENPSRGLDVTWQPVRGYLTVHP
jgi:hypothetical protein